MRKYSSLVFFLCGSLSMGLFWLLSSQMQAHSSWSMQGGPGVRANPYLRSNSSKPEEQAVAAALDPYAAFITLEVIPPYYEPSSRKKEVLVIGPYYDSGQPSVNTADSSVQKKSKRSQKKRIHQVR